MWKYLVMGIEIIIGGFIGIIIVTTIYFLGKKYWDRIGRYIKTRANKARGITPSEPTICDKLGNVKIYSDLYAKMEDLKYDFLTEEKQLQQLIEHIFPAPQITHNKFANDKERLHNAFFKQYRSLHIYYRAYPVEDGESWKVVTEGQDNLEQFYQALQDLIKELSSLLVCTQPIDNLMSDIAQDKDSVRDYHVE